MFGVGPDEPGAVQEFAACVVRTSESSGVFWTRVSNDLRKHVQTDGSKVRNEIK